MKAKLTTKEYVVPFILITTLFFLWGFSRAILDVLNKHFQNELHISITQSSLIQVTTYLGYFLLAIPVPRQERSRHVSGHWSSSAAA